MSTYTLFNNLDRVTKIKIFATPTGGKTIEIGAIQAINPSESREVTSHYTLGGENPDVPKVTVPGLVNRRQLSVRSLALFKNSIIQQLGAAAGEFMYSLKQQILPFDIQVVKEKSGDSTQTYTLTYKDCFCNDFSFDNDISRGGEVIIIEQTTVTYRDVVGQ